MYAEFTWFDSRYFQTRERADIDFYITGHGEEGELGSSEQFDKVCDYVTLYDSILNAAQDQTERIYLDECKHEQIEWYLRIMIDTCKAGSAIDIL
jgi:hypothetical protein